VQRAHKTAPLAPRNTAAVDEHAKAGTVHLKYADLLRVMADVLDNAIKGEDIYMTLGQTRNKDAVLLTVNWDREKLVLSGVSLMDLAEQAHTLL